VTDGKPAQAPSLALAGRSPSRHRTYQELGSYRAAASLCGTTDKTMKRVLARRRNGNYEYRARPPVAGKTEIARELVTEKVRATDGLITAKRLLPMDCARLLLGFSGRRRVGQVEGRPTAQTATHRGRRRAGSWAAPPTAGRR